MISTLPLLLAGAAAASSSVEADSLAFPSVVLEEVSVVAAKQEERLREEAVASTVVGHDALARLNAVALKNISDVVPNFYVPDYGSRITSSIYVRGIGARMDQPAVGLNIDNVPVMNKNAFDFDVVDIESVEMLRGPQSTLYGRNTMGGLINITTISPLRYQGLRIMARGATGNDWKASVGWYTRPSDSFASALTGSVSYLGGFFTNEYTHKKVDHELSGDLRWKFNTRLSGNVSLQNAFSISLLDQGGYPYQSVESGKISYNDPCAYRRMMLTDGLTLRWRARGFTMTSVTSFQMLSDKMTLDQDFLPDPFFTLTQRQVDLGVTEDLIFRGSVADGLYTWTAGAFGFYRNIDMQAPVTFKDRGIAELIESHRNAANPGYPIRWDGRNFVLDSDFNSPVAGAAIYHESRLHLGRWHLAAGLRLDYEKAFLHYHSLCNTGYEIDRLLPDGSREFFRHVDIDIDDSGRLSRNFTNFLPKLAVLYDLPIEGENNVYGVVSKGYKSGGFNTQMFSDVLQQRLMGLMGLSSKYDVDDIVGYRPEFSWNYEVGAHLSFPAIHLDADLSAFYIDCHDQQLTTFPDGTTTGRIMTNAGHTRSWGAEVSLNWSATERLAFNATYGFTDARFVEFFNGINDFSGKYIPYAPGNTFSLRGFWQIPVKWGRAYAVELDADVSGAGKIYWNEENSLSQPFYLLPGASISLRADKWSVQLWGKNLSSTKYYTFYFLSMGNEFLQKGRPVQVGVTFRLQL